MAPRLLEDGVSPCVSLAPPRDVGRIGLVASKELERFIYELCTAAVPGFPQGPTEDHESPDCLFTCGGHTVGVEIQEFIQGASSGGAAARKGESTRAAIMKAAQQDFESRCPGVYLQVTSHWHHSTLWEGRSVRGLARKVTTLVEHLLPPAPNPGEASTQRVVDYDELDAAGLADRLSHLTILRHRRLTSGLWAAIEVGFSSRDLDALQTQVNAKEAKVPRYRKDCDELWLVLFTGVLPSAGFDFEALPGLRVVSGFDHVVFLDAVSGKAVMLAG